MSCSQKSKVGSASRHLLAWIVSLLLKQITLWASGPPRLLPPGSMSQDWFPLRFSKKTCTHTAASLWQHEPGLLSHTQLLIFTKSVKTSCFWHLYLSVRFDRIWPTGSQLLCGSRINTVCFCEPDFCREPAPSAGILLAHQQSKGSVRCCCLISQSGNAKISPWSDSRAWSPNTPGLEDEQQQTACSALCCRKGSHWGSVSVSFLTSWDRQPVPKGKSSVFPSAGETQPWNLLLLLQLSCNMYSALLPNSHDSQLGVSNALGKGNT